MSLFTKAIPNSRPDINRRQTMIKWPSLVAMALCAAILLPGPAPATPLVDSAPEATVADGIVAIREGNFREGVAIWTPHAEAGNPAAHYGLGLVYSRDRGAGMPARPELSHRHYKAAAHRGHVDSIFELAFQYERASAPKPTRTMRWPITASPPPRTISTRSIIWQFCCHAAAM